VISIADIFSNFEGILNDFFKDLSSVYEVCKLGVHSPIAHDQLQNGMRHFDIHESKRM
jgi:hypothetical protein